MFKIFPKLVGSTNDNVIITSDNVNEIIHSLNEDEIIDMNCHGLYTDNDYNHHYDSFLNYHYDPKTFHNFLLQRTLGYQYHYYNSVRKEELPNGIGLRFTFSMKNRRTIEYIIKMPLFELKNDNTRVTYFEGQSIVTIHIRLI